MRKEDVCQSGRLQPIEKWQVLCFEINICQFARQVSLSLFHCLAPTNTAASPVQAIQSPERVIDTPEASSREFLVDVGEPDKEQGDKVSRVSCLSCWHLKGNRTVNIV